MARPDVSVTTERLYDGLGPWAEVDGEDTDWATLKLAASIGDEQEVIDSITRDTDDGPGWSVVMDVDRTPAEFLGWIAQFGGVELLFGLDDESQRIRVKGTAGFKRGSLGAVKQAAAQFLTGTRRVEVYERDGSPYRLRVRTYASETPKTVSGVIYDGVGADLLSTANRPSLNVPGDLEVVARVRPDQVVAAVDRTVASMWASTDGKRSWIATLHATGKMKLWASRDGIESLQYASVPIIPTADAEWVWLKWQLDTVTGTAYFYTAPERVGPWTLLDDSGGSTPGALNPTDQALRIGVYGSLAASFPFDGAISDVEVRSGFDGPLVSQFDASRLDPAAPLAGYSNALGDVWVSTGAPTFENVPNPAPVLAALLAQKPAGIVLTYEVQAGISWDQAAETWDGTAGTWDDQSNVVPA